MKNKKILIFCIFLISLMIFSIVPEVYAQTKNFDIGGLFQPLGDVLSKLSKPELYQNYNVIIDFLVYMIIFIALVLGVFEEQFKGRAKPLAIGVGLAMAIGLAYTKPGLIGKLGPFFGLVFLTLFIFVMYRTGVALTGSFWPTAFISYIIGFILTLMFFPEILTGLMTLGNFGRLIVAILALLFVLAIIILFLWGVFWIGGHIFPGGEGGGAAPGGFTPARRGEGGPISRALGNVIEQRLGGRGGRGGRRGRGGGEDIRELIANVGTEETDVDTLRQTVDTLQQQWEHLEPEQRQDLLNALKLNLENVQTREGEIEEEMERFNREQGDRVNIALASLSLKDVHPVYGKSIDNTLDDLLGSPNVPEQIKLALGELRKRQETLHRTLNNEVKRHQALIGRFQQTRESANSMLKNLAGVLRSRNFESARAILNRIDNMEKEMQRDLGEVQATSDRLGNIANEVIRLFGQRENREHSVLFKAIVGGLQAMQIGVLYDLARGYKAQCEQLKRSGQDDSEKAAEYFREAEKRGYSKEIIDRAWQEVWR